MAQNKIRPPLFSYLYTVGSEYGSSSSGWGETYRPTNGYILPLCFHNR